jgi:predicted component of viral defense system (DUF524 family)
MAVTFYLDQTDIESNEDFLLQEWEACEFVVRPNDQAQLELRLNGQLLEAFLLPNQADWHWRWNPQNSLGRFQLELISSNEQNQSSERKLFGLRVVPRKLAQDHYHQLLDDLQKQTLQLVAALGGGKEAIALERKSDSSAQALEDLVLFFDQRFSQIEQAVQRIEQHPNSQLVNRTRMNSLDQVREIDPDSLREFGKEALVPLPQELAPELYEVLQEQGGRLPERIRQRTRESSFDTPENRLVAYVLDQLRHRIVRIKQAASYEARRLERNQQLFGPLSQQARIQELLKRCNQIERRLHALRARPFLANLRAQPMPSQQASKLIQRDPSYRLIYQVWRDLQKTSYFSCQSPLFHLPIQELPLLYEVWATMRMIATLASLPGWQVDANAFDQLFSPTQAESLLFKLPEDQVLLRAHKMGYTLELRYQARYHPLGSHNASAIGSLDRHRRIPDIVVELHQPDGKRQLLIFDAKYRLDAQGGVPEDALADAYSYRGSIGYANGESAVYAALLLYPGRQASEVYRNRVGAFALLPQEDTALSDLLTRLLDELIERK